MADSPVKRMSAEKRFMSMMEINYEFGGQDGVNRWLAAHIGSLNERVKQQEKEIRRLKRLAAKATR